ncbi:MAG: hypothetical protein IKR37_03565 [Paludibacteraceae bacterium]|nr:hypothetical protein [Paludibacteraceae bacterium]MBR6304687.1 hypothetical protein [Paludibacteraceae bacterium]
MADNHDTWQWQEPGGAWKGAGLYHITLTIPSREPLLGTLVIPDDDATQARVEAKALGLAVLDIQKQLSSFYPEIQILHYCLMPDHLHAVWYVRQTKPRGIRSAVRGFWQEVKKAGRLSSFAPNSIRDDYQERAKILREEIGAEIYDALPPIFTEMPFIRPMGQRRQLPATIRYIDMNPQRLATKKLKPGYFRVQTGIEIAGRIYSGVGNIALLQAGRYAPVHVRRTMVEAAEHGKPQQMRDYMNGCVLAARRGTVMVSPFISPQEKHVMEVLLKEGHPFIYMADNGFRDYYKPHDGLFDAVAAGRVLILSPWEYDAAKRHVTHADCVMMNQMAEEICTFSSITPD